MLNISRTWLGEFAASSTAWLTRLIRGIGLANFFLLLLLALLTFFPLLFVGYTTNDDASIAINFGWSTSLIETARLEAVLQGRFSFIWGYPLLRLPYLLNSHIWYMAMKIGAFVILLMALYYSVRQIFKSTWIALLTILFFLAFVQNGWEHNAFTSYPFAFNLYAALFLLSLGMFSAAIEQKTVSLAIFSGIFYFFALGIELFVLFYPFYVAVLLAQGRPGVSIAERIFSGGKYLLSVTLPLMIYLGLYFLWRIIHPSIYDGNNLNGFNLLTATRVVMAYSLTALPLVSVHFLLSPQQQILIAHISGWRVIVSELTVVNFVKPAVTGFIFVMLLTATKFDLPKQRVLVWGAVWAFLGIFLPNLLLGFVQKHQHWVASGSYSYLYTYYSFISLVVFLALLTAYLKIKIKSWARLPRAVFISIGVIVVMVLSFAVDVRNGYVNLDQKLSNRKWELMDRVIRSPAFNEIPNGSIVVAPTLSADHRGIAIVNSQYWTRYVKYQTGKVVRFVDNKCVHGLPCYLLVFRQEMRADNQFVILAKVADRDLLVSSDMMIYALPKRVNSVLMGSLVADVESPQLAVNGIPVWNIGSGFFSSPWPQNSDDGLMQAMHITGNVDMIPDQMTISGYEVILHPDQVAANLGAGFYGWETEPDITAMAWSKGNSSLQIINYHPKPVNVLIRFEATALEKINLKISSVEGIHPVVVEPGVYRAVAVNLVAQPGITTLVLQSDRPPLQPGGGDMRFLSFSIRGLHVQSH